MFSGDRVTRRLVAALKAGDVAAALLLPPTAVRRQGRFVSRPPSRGTPPSLIDLATRATALAPWRRALVEIDRAWPRGTRWRKLLDPMNGALHGPALRTIFGVCLLGSPGPRDAVIASLVVDHLRAMRLLVARLARDWRGPAGITHLETLVGDPHCGQQRNVRMTLADGSNWVYKTRAIDAECRLFGENSLAAALNQFLMEDRSPLRLPSLDVRRGSGIGPDDYGYVGWIEPGRGRRVARQRHTARGVQVAAASSPHVWRDAGLLASFAYAVGLVDLHSSNLVLGRGSDGRLRFHVIDAEVFGMAVRELDQTALTSADIRMGLADHRHPGFEIEMRLCGHEADRWIFVRDAGTWTLREVGAGEMVPETATTLAVNPDGMTGYYPYLGFFLEGAITGWDLLVRHRALLKPQVEKAIRHSTIRAILRPSAEYEQLVAAALLGRVSERPRLLSAERAQIRGFDLPYFFWRAGRLRYYHGYPASRGVRHSGRSAPASSIWAKRRICEERIVWLVQDAVFHVADPNRPWRIRQNGVDIEHTGKRLRVRASVGGRRWAMVFNRVTGTATVSVD